MVNLLIFYSIKFCGGFTITWDYWRYNNNNNNYIQLGCYSDNLGESFFLMQISGAIIEKSIWFNIVESKHDTLTKINTVHTYVYKVNDY